LGAASPLYSGMLRVVTECKLSLSQRVVRSKPLTGKAEPAFCKPKVGGSIPSAGTNDINGLDHIFQKLPNGKTLLGKELG